MPKYPDFTGFENHRHRPAAKIDLCIDVRVQVKSYFVRNTDVTAAGCFVVCPFVAVCDGGKVFLAHNAASIV